MGQHFCNSRNFINCFLNYLIANYNLLNRLSIKFDSLFFFPVKSFDKNFYSIDLKFLLSYHFNRARSYSKKIREEDDKNVSRKI